MDLLLSKQPNLKFTSELPEDDESRARCIRMREDAQKSSDAFAKSLQKIFQEYQCAVQSKADLYVETEKLKQEVSELSEKCAAKESVIKQMSNELADVVIKEPIVCPKQTSVQDLKNLHDIPEDSHLIDDSIMSPKMEIFTCDFESDDFHSPIKSPSNTITLSKTSSAFSVRQPSNVENESKTSLCPDKSITSNKSVTSNKSGTPTSSNSAGKSDRTPIKSPLRNIVNSPEMVFEKEETPHNRSKNSGTLSFSSLYGGETKFVNGKRTKQTKLMLLPSNKKTDLSSKSNRNENSFCDNRLWNDSEFLEHVTEQSKKPTAKGATTESKSKASSTKCKSNESIHKFIDDIDDTMFNEITMFQDTAKCNGSLKNPPKKDNFDGFNIVKSKSYDAKPVVSKMDKYEFLQDRPETKKAAEAMKCISEMSPEPITDMNDTMFDQVNVTPISESSKLRKKLYKKLGTVDDSMRTFNPIACSTQFGDLSETKPGNLEKNQRPSSSKDTHKLKLDRTNKSTKRKFETDAQNTLNDETFFTFAEKMDKRPTDDLSDLEIDLSYDNKETHSPPVKKVLLSSFDRIPGRETVDPGYVYKEDPVRKKSDKARLEGHDCRECENYFKYLPEKERQARLNMCSRHRSKFKRRPDTPESFWDPGFPATPTQFRENM